MPPMLDWLNQLSVWIQGWISAPAGLWALFASAFLSATVLPGSSEVVLSGLITAYPDQAFPAFWVALAGNVLGGALTYLTGWAARQGYGRFQGVKVDQDGPQMQRLRRWGPPALVLSFLPLVGDAFVLAAGWLKLPLWQSMAWIALGKALRYALVIGGVLGLLNFA